MNPVEILYALSISCFLAAACIACWLAYDFSRLRRGLREDQEYDRYPTRTEPDWMRRKTNRNRP